MSNWPAAGGQVRDIATERNLRDIRKRGGELLNEARLIFPSLATTGARTLIVGQISAAGAVVLGSGFASEKTAAGKYTIKFSTELATLPVINGTFAGEGTFGFFTVAASTKKEAKVELRNAAAALADNAFNFYVFG